jgi:hypothetical protein
MHAFRWWAPAIGLAALALLGLRSDNTYVSGQQADERVAALDCQAATSTRCMIEIRYAYPAADLSVMPSDIYF